MDGIRVQETYREYRITKCAKKLKIYKPEGGLLTSLKFDTFEECHTDIDRAIRQRSRLQADKAQD